jgi:hypothetical protein
VFFYVDESGNSGNNLFDHDQKVLSYGVLSSESNVDERAAEKFAAMLNKVAMPTLHANKLKFEGLRPIGADLLILYKNLHLGFDFYFIEKRAYALVAFFNAVFDQGVTRPSPGRGIGHHFASRSSVYSTTASMIQSCTSRGSCAWSPKTV